MISWSWDIGITSVSKFYILNLLWDYPIVISGPRFVKEMRNVSIAVGREASIDCHVSDADDYKVSFLNAMKVLERYRMILWITSKNGLTKFTNLSWYRTWQH